MAPIEGFIEAPTKTRIQVGLAPAQNAIHSLLLLTETERLSGLAEWVVETAGMLTKEELKLHHLVMYGLYHAILPTKEWGSFPAYLEHLAAMAPEDLRDKIWKKYLAHPVMEGVEEALDQEAAILSKENYVEFLRQRFEESIIDEEVEYWAYDYMLDPEAMQELIVSHLTHYWDEYLAEEWKRVRPTLQEAVDAFNRIDFSEIDNVEAAEFILGQPFQSEHLEKKCAEAETLFFAPSLHVGPYIGKFPIGDSLGLIFGARLPEDTETQSPTLSQAELYVRLNALADENRLQILGYISEKGEACSTEIIRELGLSQSAASRHLTQLTATGYLISRRKDGAKCFKLDENRIQNTLETIKRFLKL